MSFSLIFIRPPALVPRGTTRQTSDFSQRPTVKRQRSPSYLALRRTPTGKRAFAALRRARGADSPAVPDETVREVDPLFLRHELHEIALDLLRRLLSRQLQPVRKAVD